MGALQQVLVIDDGVRAVDHSLAAELAERGFASVTVSLEAADEVLAVIARPAAILLHTPAGEASAFEARTLALRERMARAGIPVVRVDDHGRSRAPVDLGGLGLNGQAGAYVLNEPDR
ncbi:MULTISPECIES: hypothetical protein [Methylobacterium]|uniref:Response regulatory domain-containing protein n=1 Tax=Methylobacterium jeotgali TaxID=381630 RepID=A0ABQ4SZ18_9HYPH|nr:MULTISPECIES: hypothetical protein [Methylobacterium]PIU08488.1 MAG: hypothetical protein COT56_01155 [Methylobacterium sp. CG09_land_8_20_14_0_10_71_15]PIU15165.1 MAG: hypothetical protein COT28_05405 [Methylobacterium sp. CG08_land_8_20_14_0_20_71_15]GBU19175.1 hypothetical protein AwMethylo_33900 [Methylobacterium sp.]GJE08122.1 hypothetical protein AOPFMNJM_3456 [Methylobacterium jeotgali]